MRAGPDSHLTQTSVQPMTEAMKPPSIPPDPTTNLNRLRSLYRDEIARHHPNRLDHWPLLDHGLKAKEAVAGGWTVFILREDSGGFLQYNGVGHLTDGQLGGPLTSETSENVRAHLIKTHSLGSRDGVVMIDPTQSNVGLELERLRKRHELALGLVKQKIFLSHKGVDKAKVRDHV